VYSACIRDVETHFWMDDDYSRWYFSRLPSGYLYEDQVTRLLLEHISNSCYFVDVGANLGWYACVVAAHSQNGNVLALELDASNCERLRRNVVLNNYDNVEIMCVAVLDCAGVGYYRGRTNSALLRLDPTVRDGSKGHYQVETVMLDSVLEGRETNRLDVVKIDVEGAELRALKGMSKTLAKRRPTLIVEYHKNELAEWGESSEDLIHFLEHYSYSVFELPQGKIPGAHRALRTVRTASSLPGNCVLYAVAGTPRWEVET
jgi:FkbM family methyltransferase